ncbi:GNAT family N-acetyltransferase [Flammeovirga aprica]|uniref:GNAT family N-acetyltransferase n=1 Tax=Flammeovirga aprica JL-4 TaxID=694437 RepID=A0A7X9XCY8_9BACT|nr:GNAT family N-acetyltransferase [Flammeovirga aprica]NME72250.1 GNAT family N-acetyltransferase [Flammeovirga aprica JL-4]
MNNIVIREAFPGEYSAIGEMMVEVYSSLEGFPQREEMPDYYEMLLNVGDLTTKENITIYVAIENELIAGAVVFVKDMVDYGSEGIATSISNACGFRLLTVDHRHQGKGIGKKLVEFCLQKGQNLNRDRLIIHSTKPMKLAWEMYERLGFTRDEKLDIEKEELKVYGFNYNYR